MLLLLVTKFICLHERTGNYELKMVELSSIFVLYLSKYRKAIHREKHFIAQQKNIYLRQPLCKLPLKKIFLMGSACLCLLLK